MDAKISPALEGLTPKELSRELRDLAPRAMNRATKSAIDRTLRKARTATSKLVRQQLALKARTVNDVISIRKAKVGLLATSGSLVVSRKAIALKEYGARQTKKGVTYRILKGGGRKRKTRAFIVGTIGGHVFERAKGAGRLPIVKQWGPSVLSNLMRRQREWDKVLEIDFEAELEGRIAWELEKSLRKRLK